jgi:hypothetical protein
MRRIRHKFPCGTWEPEAKTRGPAKNTQMEYYLLNQYTEKLLRKISAKSAGLLYHIPYMSFEYQNRTWLICNV